MLEFSLPQLPLFATSVVFEQRALRLAISTASGTSLENKELPEFK